METESGGETDGRCCGGKEPWSQTESRETEREERAGVYIRKTLPQRLWGNERD